MKRTTPDEPSLCRENKKRRSEEEDTAARIEFGLGVQMWHIIPTRKNGKATEVQLWFRDAGGNGDCMFHSIAACFNHESPDSRTRWDYQKVRDRIASAAVTSKAAPDALMDMAGQGPASLSEPMVQEKPTWRGAFEPTQAWNAAAGDVDKMASMLSDAIKTPGNTFWGNSTAAALAEIAFGVNVILLEDELDSSAPMSKVQHESTKDIYGEWALAALKSNEDVRAMTDEQVVRYLADHNYTIELARNMVRRKEPQSWTIRGYRFPIGSVRKTFLGDNSVKLMPYSATRPTIVLWNKGENHWVPVAVGCNPYDVYTMVTPDMGPLRETVDGLLSNP